MTPTWAILSGEYPPDLGGVSDYTHQVAQALSATARGDRVHVFVPARTRRAAPGATAPDPVLVHELPDRFGMDSLVMLDDAVDRLPQPAIILVQYVPHAFGWAAMNVPLCGWLLSRARRQRVIVTFHEVAYPIRRTQPLKHNLLGLVNRIMAAMLVRAARRGGAIVTIPAWEALLRNLGARGPIHVAPVPSNLPTGVCDEASSRRRAELIDGAETLIGVFGSFDPHVRGMLDHVLPMLLQRSRRIRVVLIGRGSDEYRAISECDGRMIATGALPASDAATTIAACDLLVQPYPDGVSGRRGSTSAALALGAPVVTNMGVLSEDFWEQSNAVALSPSPDPRDIVQTTERLLADPDRRKRLRCAAIQLYEQRFALCHTVALLLALAGDT